MSPDHVMRVRSVGRDPFGDGVILDLANEDFQILPTPGAVVRRSDGSSWLLSWSRNAGHAVQIRVRAGRTVYGNAQPRHPVVDDEIDIVSSEGLLPLALAAMTTDVRAPLGDAVLERRWRHPFIEAKFGRTRRGRWKQRRGSATDPTKDWARAVTAALLFEEWSTTPWRRSASFDVYGGAYGASEMLRDAVIGRLQEIVGGTQIEVARGAHLDRIADLYGIRRTNAWPGNLGGHTRDEESDDALRERLMAGLRGSSRVTPAVVQRLVTEALAVDGPDGVRLAPPGVTVEPDPNSPGRMLIRVPVQLTQPYVVHQVAVDDD